MPKIIKIQKLVSGKYFVMRSYSSQNEENHASFTEETTCFSAEKMPKALVPFQEC